MTFNIDWIKNHYQTLPGKMEELKGRAQGFYIDRNITLTKEVTEGDMDEKLKRMFPRFEDVANYELLIIIFIHSD